MTSSDPRGNGDHPPRPVPAGPTSPTGRGGEPRPVGEPRSIGKLIDSAREVAGRPDTDPDLAATILQLADLVDDLSRWISGLHAVVVQTGPS